MPSWEFEITKVAERDLDILSPQIRSRVIKRLKWFVKNFDHVTPIPLSGMWQGFFKLRVGDWRIIYEVSHHEMLITIHVVDHRSRIYKR